MTERQEEILAGNRFLVCVEVLPDGDLLCLDNVKPKGGPFAEGPGHFGPYILTRASFVQGVNWHYRYRHARDVPTEAQGEQPPTLTDFKI